MPAVLHTFLMRHAHPGLKAHAGICYAWLPARRRWPAAVPAFAHPQIIHARREAFASRTQPGGKAGSPACSHSLQLSWFVLAALFRRAHSAQPEDEGPRRSRRHAWGGMQRPRETCHTVSRRGGASWRNGHTEPAASGRGLCSSAGAFRRRRLAGCCAARRHDCISQAHATGWQGEPLDARPLRR